MQRAVDEFPANFFTLKQTQDGAMAVHILIAIYMFGALAIVCDDYFVSSLEAICERKYNSPLKVDGVGSDAVGGAGRAGREARAPLPFSF